MTQARADALLQLLHVLEPRLVPPPTHSNLPAVEIPVAALASFLTQLRDHPELRFDQLVAHTAADGPEHIDLLYVLHSSRFGHELLVSSRIDRTDPEAPTASGIWPIAEWQEREVYDLFGVRYEGHPDLRRLLLDDTWTGHPLRKDYRDDFTLEPAP